MTFRDDRQRGEVARVLTDRLNKGVMFRADEAGIPRPTGLLKSHLSRVYSSFEVLLVRLAWDVWNGDGHTRIDLCLVALDAPNLRMVGELLVAAAEPGFSGADVDEWIVRWGGQ
jgi:hypothetical protein